jgi:hypothetical protein
MWGEHFVDVELQYVALDLYDWNTSVLFCCTREFLAKNKITTMGHPPYSPDLALCDFYLLPKAKNIMWGEHFVDVDTIKRETTKPLKELTKKDMQHFFQEWEKYWTKCILSGEEYLRVTTSPFQNNLVWIFCEPSARTFCTHLVCSLIAS